MRSLLRGMMALLLGLVAVLPVLGGDTRGGGESGVWILPRACSMSGTVGDPPLSEARANQTFPLSGNIQAQLPAEMGPTLVTMVPRGTSELYPLAVVNGSIQIPATLLQSLAAGGIRRADILAADPNNLGLRLALLIDDNAGAANLYVF